MSKIKKLTSIWMIMLIGGMSKVYAVTTRTFKRTKDTADHSWTQVEGKRSILDMISLVNEYLWFTVWLCCFLFMIYNGFQLITAQGDKQQSGKAINWLKWSVIWIVICLLAYIIVNLAVKLFA